MKTKKLSWKDKIKLVLKLSGTWLFFFYVIPLHLLGDLGAEVVMFAILLIITILELFE